MTIHRNFIRAVLSLALALYLSPRTLRAQETEPQLDKLAKEMAHALVRSDVHTVVVFDFAGPARKVSTLGQDLAGEFGLTLQKESASLSVVNRTVIQTVIETNRLVPAVVSNTELAAWLASQLKADAFIVGSLIPANGQLSVGVQSIRVKTQNVIAEFTVSMPFSGEMGSRLGMFVGPMHEVDSKKLMLDKGTMPKCIRCPSPSYSRAAVDARIQGIVILSVLVGFDGRARDIDVIKSLSYGLNEEAIKTIKTWVFAPGKSADGKMLEIEVPIQVTFN